MTDIHLDAAVPELTPRYINRHLPRLQAGGLQAVLATAASIQPPDQALLSIARWWEAHHDPGKPVRIAKSVEELRAIVADDELAVVLHFQGTPPLGGTVEMLDAYYHLGVRVIQLTYNHAGSCGDGCLEERDAGLTDLGRKALGRMHQLGIAPDLTHAGERTCLDALGVAERPVVATHSNAKTVCDSPRNLSDEVIDGIAATEGVIGVVAFPAFVSDQDPTLDKLIDHVVYIAERVGIGHVGIGTDFADEDEEDFDFFGYDPRYYPRPPWVWPRGIAWWEDIPNIPDALAARGFAEVEIAGVMGENFLRVFGEVWTPPDREGYAQQP
jgi:membrane dipeptidase